MVKMLASISPKADWSHCRIGEVILPKQVTNNTECECDVVTDTMGMSTFYFMEFYGYAGSPKVLLVLDI